jgi:hypothetical protein
MAWTGADVDHPIFGAARTNASVLDAAQTVAAGALEALALGPRGEPILLWSDEAGGRGAASRHGPPTSAPGQAVATQRPLAVAPALRDHGPSEAAVEVLPDLDAVRGSTRRSPHTHAVLPGRGHDERPPTIPSARS